MPASKARFRYQFARIAVALLACSSAVGVVLLLLGAPLWAYYVAPTLGLPILFPLLRQRIWEQTPEPTQRNPRIDTGRVVKEQFAAVAAARIRLTDVAEYLLAPAVVTSVLAVFLLPTDSDARSSAAAPVLVVIGVLAVLSVAAVTLKATRARADRMRDANAIQARRGDRNG